MNQKEYLRQAKERLEEKEKWKKLGAIAELERLLAIQPKREFITFSRRWVEEIRIKELKQ